MYRCVGVLSLWKLIERADDRTEVSDITGRDYCREVGGKEEISSEGTREFYIQHTKHVLLLLS